MVLNVVTKKVTSDSPGLNNREWIETIASIDALDARGNSPGLNNREWIETYNMHDAAALGRFSRFK